MEEFNCSDSSEMNAKDNLVRSNDFQGMLEGLEDEDHKEEMNCSIGKKKRLTIDQVRALEKIFEVDSRLDQERKIKLAHELGLQPRQVAIWFQNRRARWKTKQLERDYRLLKANYEGLQLNYSKVEQEKEGLVAELRGLKEKLGEENIENNHRSIEKTLSSHSPQSIFPGKCNDSTETDHEVYTGIHLSNTKRMKDFKEGLSDDSDSSGILHEDSYFNTQPMTSRLASCSAFDGNGMDQSAAFSLSTSSSVYHPPLMDSRGAMMRAYQQQFVMMEEQNFFTTDDSAANLLPIDPTPFFWYFSDQRN